MDPRYELILALEEDAVLIAFIRAIVEKRIMEMSPEQLAPYLTMISEGEGS